MKNKHLFKDFDFILNLEIKKTNLFEIKNSMINNGWVIDYETISNNEYKVTIYESNDCKIYNDSLYDDVAIKPEKAFKNCLIAIQEYYKVINDDLKI